MSRNTRAQRNFWFVGFGLGLVGVVVFFVLLNTNSRTMNESSVQEATDPIAVVPLPKPTTIQPVVAIQEIPQLPFLDFPPGSVEEACGLNEYEPYDLNLHTPWPKSPFNADGELLALDSEECWTALEHSINAINPYLFRVSSEYGQFPFIELENPLTFERIFADPVGDFRRVLEALSRSECLLNREDEPNWDLKETCHADALLNYATFNRFCYFSPITSRKRTYSSGPDTLTPEQDRFRWKRYLERAWVDMKCEEFDSELKLTADQYPELSELLLSLGSQAHGAFVLTELIELAARLGDDAAGLTQVPTFISVTVYPEDGYKGGYKYGPFKELLTSTPWKELQRKKPPSTERFLQVFTMLERVENETSIKFDWEQVVRRLCTPPYNDPPGFWGSWESTTEMLRSDGDDALPDPPP